MSLYSYVPCRSFVCKLHFGSGEPLELNHKISSAASNKIMSLERHMISPRVCSSAMSVHRRCEDVNSGTVIVAVKLPRPCNYKTVHVISKSSIKQPLLYSRKLAIVIPPLKFLRAKCLYRFCPDRCR